MKKWGCPRKSQVVKDGKGEVKVPNTMHILGISKDGFIKKISSDEISIGNVGKTSNVMATIINNLFE